MDKSFYIVYIDTDGFDTLSANPGASVPHRIQKVSHCAKILGVFDESQLSMMQATVSSFNEMKDKD